MLCDHCKKEFPCNKSNYFPECHDNRHKYCVCLECAVIAIEGNKTFLIKRSLDEKETIDELITCYGVEAVKFIVARHL